MTDHRLLILPYGGASPRLASDPLCDGPGAAVLGRAIVGRNARFGAMAVVRADGHDVTIGDDFWIGARGTVHIAHDRYPAVIGSGVTAGAGSVVHACTVGDNCHIGSMAVILDGSVVGPGCALVEASVIYPRSVLKPGWLYAGAPASPIRPMEPGEVEALGAATRAAPEPLRVRPPSKTPHPRAGEFLFIAANARLSGDIRPGGDNGIWFGCDLDAGSHAVTIGPGTNIQDNTVIRAMGQDVSIGREATVGHNVTMMDCTVGDRSLIGIGAVVSPGTVVGDDVLLAAGAFTTKGQVLDGGFLYGGRPAKKLREIGDERRAMIARTFATYCDYARGFAAAQRDAGLR